MNSQYVSYISYLNYLIILVIFGHIFQKTKKYKYFKDIPYSCRDVCFIENDHKFM